MDARGSTKTSTDVELDCADNGARLLSLISKYKSQGNFEMIMDMFLHSTSCTKKNCKPLCLMFRRVNKHMKNHHCTLKDVCDKLLDEHVRSCINPDCDNDACKSEKEKRLEGDHHDHHQQQQQPAATAAVDGGRRVKARTSKAATAADTSTKQ